MKLFINDKKMRTIAIMLLLFSANLIPGMIWMNEGLFHFDSVRLAQAVEESYQNKVLYGQAWGRYGSVILCMAIYFPFYIFGQNADFAIRFSSVLFHALSIVAVFLLLLEFFENKKIAFFAALIMSYVSLYFVPNTYGKEHGASMFFAIFACYLLLKAVKRTKSGLFVLSALLFSFSVMIRESLFSLLPLYITLFFYPKIQLKPVQFSFPDHVKKLKSYLAFFLPLIIVIGIGVATYLAEVFYSFLFEQNESIPTFLGFFSSMQASAINDLRISLPISFFIIASIGLLLFIARYFKTNLYIFLFFIAWLGLFFYFANIETYKARYLDIILVPLALFASFGVMFFYQKQKLIGTVILISLVISIFFLSYPLISYRSTYNGEKQFSLFIKEHTEPDAKIIAIDDSPFIVYYGNRSTIGFPIENKEQIKNFIEELRSYLINGTSIYLAESALRSYDIDGALQDALLKNFNITFIGSKIMEDYHNADIKFTKYEAKLFKITQTCRSELSSC